jgi:UDP-glucose 4-epimerase
MADIVRKVIVTGGAGFIGSSLTEALIAEGAEVHVVDNLATGRLENLASLKSEPRLHVHELDINDLERIEPVFVGAREVYHLAALADIVPSIERPLDYTRANVNGTLSVLEAARKARVGRLVYTASSSCYGIPDAFPTPENAEARPQYPYALSKYLGEQAALHWSQVYGLPLVSLRLFNVYGPRARTTGSYGAMFGVFLAQKLAGKPFTIVGDGSQTRDFTFVTDVVEAFLRAARSSLSGVALNVGSGKPTSVKRIAELLGGPVVHIPKRPGEPDCTHADTSRIRELLGFEASVSIETGVRIMLEHIGHFERAPVWTPESISLATQAWFEHLGQERPEVGAAAQRPGVGAAP